MFFALILLNFFLSIECAHLILQFNFGLIQPKIGNTLVQYSIINLKTEKL